ncbi:MAG: tRNA epoxyqueuosine(34) reductase QueG [Gemmatimonadetes bacterium]|nr:tRNA epoxyqueuosine(34) reductase QueG [Gemmatimonadota bacterium]MYG85834.1 tRNA epoxyqueuosine(34) reductase QueG [Gemmatimonadota bacterium]MYJ89750.1 tRNA epoxyqueuosine(34) reductase QueG [Gemmatimonadota bacterium]
MLRRPADRRRDNHAAQRIPVSLTEEIKAHAASLGFDLAGITTADPPRHGDYYAEWVAQGMAGEMAYLDRQVEKRQDPRNILPNARSLVVVAMNYRCPDPDPVSGMQAAPPRGKIARYARGDDYHDVMKEKLLALLRFVQERAGRPVEGKVYVDTGPVLEREFAVRAGLGWFGKHTNLIHKRVGSWLLIGEILLDIELDPDGPTADHCGTCTLCLEACPTDAIVEPYVVDSRRCISYHTIELKGAIPLEYRAAMGDRVFGCDDCQDVCPWNRSAPETGLPAFAARPWNEMPDLIEMLGLTPEAFRNRFKGSPVKRTKRRGLLRNAAVALGNTKDPGAVPALADSLGDDEPLVRGHAAWALGNVGGAGALAELEKARKTEEDPWVVEEIDRALAECAKSSRVKNAS